MANQSDMRRDETRRRPVAMASPPPEIGFRDLDDEHVFEEAQRLATSKGRKNFVVEFGADHARIAYDLTCGQFDALLARSRDEKYPIRWM